MAELTRIESMQYPAGHLAHLSEGQQAQLDAFKKLCEENKYYTPETDDKDASHDDETLLYGYFPGFSQVLRGTDGLQALPARTTFCTPGGLQAVQGYRRLAKGKQIGAHIRAY